MKNSMKKTITMLLVLLLAVSMCSFAAFADGENEPDLAAAPDLTEVPDLAVTAPAPGAVDGEGDLPAVDEEPALLAPVPDGAELVPNDAVPDGEPAPVLGADDSAAADEGGCNPTVWIIVACVAVVAIVVIVVLAKKKKK